MSVITILRSTPDSPIYIQEGLKGKIREVTEIHIFEAASPDHKTTAEITIYGGAHALYLSLRPDAARKFAEAILNKVGGE